jgi:serine/threonine protein kinase
MISSSSTMDNKENDRNKQNQNTLKKEFQNNFNYIIDSGRLLKEFKDFHFIGKGGFGVVLKASNILDEGQWAIKIMRINLDLRKAKELNAIQEIKMMSKFKKKNIVRYKTCWFEFAQNDTIDKINKRIRSISFDDNEEKNKKNKINKKQTQKIEKNNGIIFEEIKKQAKRKTSVIYDRKKDKDIFEEKEEEVKKKNTKPKTEKNIKKKRRISMIWDDEENEDSDDSLGANKNYIIKEEGKEIHLDDNNDFIEEEEISNEEEDEENSSYYEENKEIIKEEKESENISESDDYEDEYNDLKYNKNESKIKVNDSSSNIVSNSNSISENKKVKEETNKKSDSKLIIYFFIQMEYCSGCPMNYYLSHRKSVPSKSLTSYIFFQMCYAVKHIHEGNIIHRDLKPGNIFIMKDYLIKIGDFGLALNFGKTKNEQGGTYLYQSPEQIENKTYDQKVDIFALGVILVELVSKFDTEFERVEVLQGLKKNLYPEYLEKDHLNEYNLIKKMTKLKKEERPNIQDIFNDSDFIELINSH